MKTQAPTKPAPRKLTLKKETLRRLTPAALRLAAGGAVAVPHPKSTAWTGRGYGCPSEKCWTDGCWTWGCPK